MTGLNLLAGQLSKKFIITDIADRKMHVAGTGLRDPQAAINRILRGIDANHENPVVALAGS